MAKPRKEPGLHKKHVVSIRFTDEEFEQYRRLCRLVDKPMAIWAEQTVKQKMAETKKLLAIE